MDSYPFPVKLGLHDPPHFSTFKFFFILPKNQVFGGGGLKWYDWRIKTGKNLIQLIPIFQYKINGFQRFRIKNANFLNLELSSLIT